MTADLRSIWLMPAPADQAFLAALVGELAARFGTPMFAPHLTLRGDVGTAAARLAEEIAVAADRVAPFSEPIAAVEATDSFFRAFYARFPVSPPLASLKASLDPEAAEPFLPHVSLLYGSLQAERKASAVAEIGRRLAGRAIGFDRICVVSAGQDIPIADWSVLATAPLRRG